MAAPCIFFQKGRCNAGRTCKFSHDPSVLTKKVPTAPCKYFQEGRCTAGDACLYGHVLTKKEKPKPPGGATFLATPTVPKPSAGIVVHAKGWLGSHAAAAHAGGVTLGHTPDDDKYVSELLEADAAGADGAEEGREEELPKGAAPAAPLAYASLARRGLDEDTINASAVVLAASAPLSEEDGARRQAVREQVAASADKECGICMEKVIAKGCLFGLLDGCDHIFCVECIREWRAVNTLDKQVKRSCPMCRCSSNFVIPSSYVPADASFKADVIASYHNRLTKIACKHFNLGAGTCPFGSSCFYEHRYKDGTLQQLTAPRLKVTEDGEVEAVKKLSLFDMLDLEGIDVAAARGRRR